MKDRNYWLERGKDGPKEEGYICIGKGDENEPLAYQINTDTNNILAEREGEGFVKNWLGGYHCLFYYLTEQKFNELFPEQKNKNINRKFRIKSEEHGRAIQNRLFELGCKWWAGGNGEPKYLNKPFLFADCLEKDITYCDSESYFKNHRSIESTLDDLFEYFEPIEVNLNNQYAAIVHKDKIVVGCQEFSMEVFEELKKAVDKVKE